MFWARYCPSYTPRSFSILKNKLIGYADDSYLLFVVPSPGVRVTVADSLNHDLGKVSEWCGLWGMKLNAIKTKTMIGSRSRTMHLQSPSLTIGETVLKEADVLEILRVTFESRMTFEKHLLKGLVSWRSPGEYSMTDCFFWNAFWILSWVSETHPKRLNRVVRGASFLTGGVLGRDIAHRRSVAVLCMLYRITRCCNRASLHLFGFLLHNLAVSHDFYSPASISVERSSWPRVRSSGTGRFQEPMPMTFYWHSCSLRFCLQLFSIFLLSFYGLVSLSHILTLSTFFKLIIIIIRRRRSNAFRLKKIIYVAQLLFSEQYFSWKIFNNISCKKIFRSIWNEIIHKICHICS